MKSLDDVQAKMSALYEQVESGAMELKQADSLANIAGKYLKAEQLKFAREVFVGQRVPKDFTPIPASPPLPTFPAATQLIASGEKGRKAA